MSEFVYVVTVSISTFQLDGCDLSYILLNIFASKKKKLPSISKYFLITCGAKHSLCQIVLPNVTKNSGTVVFLVDRYFSFSSLVNDSLAKPDGSLVTHKDRVYRQTSSSL